MHNHSYRTVAGYRAAFLASSAMLCALAPAVSQAQSLLDPAAAKADLTSEFRAAQGSRVQAVAPTPQVVIADPGTPTTARDPDDITGVGQMVIDIGDGFVGLCTGTLINPRTVISAAHCVNDLPASSYGAASGGTPIGYGFSKDNLPGVRSWYLPGDMQYQTNLAAAFFNVNYVAYHPGSLEPEAASFLYSDVSIASLDTPAVGIPTWALLFSALPDPGPISAEEGTGYHVVLDGYGRNGTGTTGSIGGIDYRRRIADNMLGALSSLDVFETFLFGEPNGLYQNLYWIDFDDPQRGTVDASPYDFNAWRDNATPHEGITASGDSGGPLILDDTFQIPVVIGVLSGGYTQFYLGQAPNGYGTASFYQPLYLYWDWVAANNPYHYASAKPGDGAWEDPSHWVTTLDPNYWVLDENGNLVNGIPTQAGEGKDGSSGQFGQTCFQTELFSDCYDVATGEETFTGDPIGTGSAVNDKAVVAFAEGSAEATDEVPSLPSPTLGNGLPGASDFVPDNFDGDREAGEAPRYFDITLAAAGKTTLSSTVTIDRLKLANAGAALDIAANGSLTSLIDVTQVSGMMRVNGSLTTRGDYLLMSGGLQGSGTITTPYFTSMAGVIAPGGIGSIGQLTFNGNVGLASGTVYLVDLGGNGVSDRIAVQATTYEGEDPDDGEEPPVETLARAAALVPVDGYAVLGGSVAFSPLADTMVRDGYTYTIVTAEGGIEGEFAAPAALSAILTPELTYSDHAVTVEIEAGTYASVVDSGSPIQTAYAQLLDQNRVQYGTYADLYGPMDLMSQSQIRGTLETFAPRIQPLLIRMGVSAVESGNRFIRDRLNTVADGSAGGSLSYYGSPFQVASAQSRTAAAQIASDAQAAEATAEGVLPDDMSGFLAGGYIDGDSSGMPTAVPYARDDFDGYYIAGGLEKAFGENGVAGLAVSYTRMDGQTGAGGETAKADLFQLSFYAANRFASGIQIDGQLSAGAYDLKTARTLSAGASTFDLGADDTPFVFSGEVGVGKAYQLGAMFEATPRLALRYAHIGFTRTAEQGGGPALQYDLGNYDSLQSRAGLTLAGKGRIRPYLTGTYVHDFKDKPIAFGANFVGGVGPDVLFALPGTDRNWGEVGGGISTGGRISLSLAAETTIGRGDVDYQVYRGAVSIKF